MSSILSAAKSNFFRGTQQVKAAFGKAETSVDGPYDDEVSRFKNSHSAVKKLKKECEKLLENIKEFAASQTTVADCFLAVLDAAQPMYQTTVRGQDAIKSADAARTRLEEQIRRDAIEPLNRYLAQYDDIESRVKAAGNHRLDMDRYSDELKSQRNKNPNDPRVATTEAKLSATTASYHALRDPLLVDIPALLAERHFLDACVASYMSALAEYYRMASQSLSSLGNVFANVERKTQPAPKPVAPVVPQVQAGGYQMGRPPVAPVSPRGPQPDTAQVPPPISPRAYPQAPPPAPARALPPPPPLPKRQPQAKALYDFAATSPGELSFPSGEVLTIHSQDGDWWEAEHHGRRGTVPRNYVQLM